MMMNENAKFLIGEAVRALTVGEDDVKRRLWAAYLRHLMFVSEEHIPADFRPLLASIHTRLTRTPRYKGQSTVESALFGMHKRTAAKITVDIFELYLGVAHRPNG